MSLLTYSSKFRPSSNTPLSFTNVANSKSAQLDRGYLRLASAFIIDLDIPGHVQQIYGDITCNMFESVTRSGNASRLVDTALFTVHTNLLGASFNLVYNSCANDYSHMIGHFNFTDIQIHLPDIVKSWITPLTYSSVSFNYYS
jgi:hypothetical protein